MALLATEPAAANLAAAAFGFGVGVVFTVILALPLAIAADPREAGQISALMLFVGYLFAAASPVGLGAIRDIVGTFSVSLWVLVLGACALPTLLWVNTPRPGSADRVPGQSGPSQARP
jgi:MFS transporter, CP family, cyanate transporter